MKTFLKSFCIYILMLVLIIPATAQHLKLIKKTVIGGEGGWDYLSVDPDNRRIYISHSTQVEVLNADTHEKIGVISNLQGVHGVIAVPHTGRGITTNGKSNNVTIFDLKTLKPIIELPTGKNPDALLYDPYSNMVYVFDHSDVTTTIIDIAAGKVAGSVDMGGTKLEAGASDGKGTIYVNLEDVSEIAGFDTRTLKVTHKWKLAPCEEPTGMAYDPKTKRLMSVCHSGVMMVVDTESGKIVAQPPIGKRVDGVVFDPELKMAYSSNGEGSITVIQEVSADQWKVIETIKTLPGAKTIAWDSKTHHLFVTSAEYGETPAATTENPNPRPKIIPGTFMLLEFGISK